VAVKIKPDLVISVDANTVVEHRGAVDYFDDHDVATVFVHQDGKLVRWAEWQ
jgi:hypothetical protein